MINTLERVRKKKQVVSTSKGVNHGQSVLTILLSALYVHLMNAVTGGLKFTSHLQSVDVITTIFIFYYFESHIYI